MRFSRFVLLAGAIAGLNILVIQAVPKLITGQEAMSQEKMQAQMMKYGTPGKPHELFKKLAGEWDVEVTATPPMPGAQPQKSKGTMKSELIFGGRYLKSDFDGMMGNESSKGLQINGYDLFKNVYSTFWIDSWSTSFLILTGRLDASGKVLTQTGQSPNAMTDGKTMDRIRAVTTLLDEGKYKFELFMTMGTGPEMKTLELIYTRKM